MVDISKEFHPLEFQPAAQQEPKDFWFIVALMASTQFDGTPRCPIIEVSTDAQYADLVNEWDWFDNGGSRVWCKDKKPGVYKLRLRPWSHGPDLQGEYDSGIDAYEAKLLYEFTDDDLR